MPECHACLWNGKKSRRCLTCRGPSETNRKGRSILSLNSPGVEAQAVRAAIGEDLADDLLARCAAVFRAWLCLDPTLRHLVAARLRWPLLPGQLEAFVRELGREVQAAGQYSQRHLWPALKDAIPMRLLSDGRRKKARE